MKHYNAELESVDFVKSFEAARLNINSWVEEKTQGGSYTLTYTLICMLVDTHVSIIQCNYYNIGQTL